MSANHASGIRQVIHTQVIYTSQGKPHVNQASKGKTQVDRASQVETQVDHVSQV